MTIMTRSSGQTVFAISTALALTIALPAMAQQGGTMCSPMAGNGGMSTITVNGTGEARITPDMATIQLGVTTQAESATEAMSQNATRQTAVIAALADAGIEQADIQTSGLNLNPMVDYGENSAPTVVGYQASNMVSVRVKEIDNLGQVMDAIVNAGANEINGISFQREDGSDAEDDARRKAVEDARRKAEVLAEASGLTLGPVLSLRDTPQPDGPRPMMMEARAASAGSSTPIAAGELSMSAQVQAEYALMGDGACAPREGGHHGQGGQQQRHGMHGRGAKPAGGMQSPMGTDQGAPAQGEPAMPMGNPPADDAPEGGAPSN